MPSQIVIDFLKANSWTATENPLYDSEVGKLSNQSKLNQQLEINQRYKIIYKNIEDIEENYNNSFDCIFSIACFEHISRLPEAFDKMWRLLKPGGKLFSMFSPIWSCYDGHHLYHLKIPERFGFKEKKILSPWDHILKTRYQLHKELSGKFDRSFADEIIYHTFNNNHINRYFFEDYQYIFENSNFNLDKLFPTYKVDVPEPYQIELERMSPGYKNFSHMGWYLYLSK